MFLSFNGKEFTRDNIISIMKPVGIGSSSNYLDFVSSLNLKNDIIAYAPAVYFLKVVKKDVNPENVLKVVKAIRISPNEEIGRHVLDIYSGSEKLAEEPPTTKTEEKFMKMTRSAAILMDKVLIT